MKKVLLLLIIILLCGCNKEVSKPYSDKNNMEKNQIVKCPVLNDIKFVYYSYFITNEGYIYKIGNYSDGTNCKKLSDDLKFTKIIDQFLVDENEELYSLDIMNINHYEYKSNYKPILEIEGLVRAYIDRGFDPEVRKDIVYLLKDDGKIYIADYGAASGGFISIVTNMKEYLSYDNEKIIDFYIDGGTEKISWVKTDKSYYVISKIDNGCEKYDDVECEYTLKKDDYLTSKYSEIAYIYECFTSSTECNYVLKNGHKYVSHYGG